MIGMEQNVPKLETEKVKEITFQVIFQLISCDNKKTETTVTDFVGLKSNKQQVSLEKVVRILDPSGSRQKANCTSMQIT